LDNDLCKDYIGDTEVVNHDGEEAEMIELCAGDIEATNLNEEETAMSDLLAPSTRESSAQNILDNPTTKDMGDHFQFGSVFIKKKVTKFNFFLKKPKPGQTNWFPFGSIQFFREKNRFKMVWLSFSDFASVFFDLARFFQLCSVFPVWLGFFF
jgi:hypothetical protein